MRSIRILVPLLALTVLAGCDTLDGLLRERLVAGTVVKSPDVFMPDGTPVSEGITTALVFYGEKETDLDIGASPPAGIPGATVQVEIFDPLANAAAEVPLQDLGDGRYAASSVDDPELAYVPGGEYRVTIEDDEPLPFVVVADQAPSAEPPRNVPETHPAGVDLTVSRVGLDTAFLSVLRLDGTGLEETWTNRPETPAGLIQVVLDPSPWQAAEFTIPGQEAFPTAGPYAVVLTTVERGVPDTSLFSGSAVFVGAGSARSLVVE